MQVSIRTEMDMWRKETGDRKRKIRGEWDEISWLLMRVAISSFSIVKFGSYHYNISNFSIFFSVCTYSLYENDGNTYDTKQKWHKGN
jgi:hypothetical protein